MPTTTGPDVRSGLTRLLEWLTSHPKIPLAYVDSTDDLSAELFLVTGRFDALAAAAETAESLSDPKIKVTDSDRFTELVVYGEAACGGVPTLDVVATAVVHDQARAALLSALPAPQNPAAHTWFVTAEHLRGLVETARSAVGAS